MILLAKIHRLDLLLHLCEEVIIPASVLDEVNAKPGKENEQILVLLQSQRFQLRKPSEQGLERLPADLGPGERESIALALETEGAVVLLDDQQGRYVARDRGLSVSGTIGILVEAREKGLISSVRQELDRLIESGMWIDEAFYHRILLEFGE